MIWVLLLPITLHKMNAGVCVMHISCISLEQLKVVRIENKRWLQTLFIDNAWSNNKFIYYLTFRMLTLTS